jgi:phage shock protein B
MSEVLAILFMVVVLPLVIVLHYVTKWRESRTLSKDEEKMLEDLWSSAQRMESRINSLETILEDVAPDWRRKV